MASIDELIALIEADIGKSDSANASIESSRAEAQELAGLFMAMNVDGQAARTGQVQQALTEALAQGPAIRAKLAEAKARAEALKTRGSGGGRTVSAAPAPTPLTAAPQAIREPVAKTGDAIKPVEAAPETARRQGINMLLSKTEDVQGSMKEFAGTADRIISVKDNGKDFFTPLNNTNASTQVPQGQTSIRAQDQQLMGLDDGAMAIYVSAVTITESVRWMNRSIKNRRRKGPNE